MNNEFKKKLLLFDLFLAVEAKEWDESKHPRVPAGSSEGGEFTEKDTILDEQGNPLLVYHGTKNDFTEFDKTKIGSNLEDYSFGFHFNSSSEAPSQIYAKGGGYLKEAYLLAKNPLIIKGPDDIGAENYLDTNRFDIMRQVLESRKSKKPYDAVIVSGWAGGKSIVVFDNKQIKVKNKEYWILIHSVRKGSKVIQKKKYIGKTLPPKARLEHIKKEFLKELSGERYKFFSEEDIRRIKIECVKGRLEWYKTGIECYKLINELCGGSNVL